MSKNYPTLKNCVKTLVQRFVFTFQTRKKGTSIVNKPRPSRHCQWTEIGREPGIILKPAQQAR